MEAILDLVRRYSSRGILVDTNILLLLLVGLFDRKQISRFKRTSQFTEADYDLLVALLANFQRIVTSPNILTEVSNLSGQFKDPSSAAYFGHFAASIAEFDERYIVSGTASQMPQFSQLGLTDCGILHLAKDRYVVLTDDTLLYLFSQDAGIDVINFNYIREFGRS
jgi:hypothetical protein